MCFLWQIMCKVVTMLSKDTVEHLLLPRFCDLCSDARLFQVRKVRTPKNIFRVNQTSQYIKIIFCNIDGPVLYRNHYWASGLSNMSMSLFSLGIHSITQHVSLNSVVCITFAHTMLLFSPGMLMFSYWCWLGEEFRSCRGAEALRTNSWALFWL